MTVAPTRTGSSPRFDQSKARSDKASIAQMSDDGSSSLAYTVSPYHLRVPTLGEL
jgi:hypothetical protein